MAPALLKSSPQRLSPLIPQRFKSTPSFQKNFTNGRGTSSCGAALASALLKPSYSTVYFHPVLDDSDSPRSSSPSLPNQYVHHSHCGWCDPWRSLQAVSRIFGGVLKHKVGSGGAQRIDESIAGTALSNRSSRIVARPNPGTVRGRAAVLRRVDLSSGDFIVATRSPPCPRSSSSRSSSNLSAFTLLPSSGQRQPRSPWARFFANWDGAHAHCKGTTCDSVGVIVDTGDFYLGRENSTQVPQGFNRRSRHSNGRPVFTDCQRLV
ncbi:hypothetical protein R3P38DRAFT_3104359 [Favolaschia claudopus]|uniref:Uncharacterized protein n=1 Tax=Favolaschia claudopus TaxID=2862362 RepID=A0AAV9ZJN2_9AGAR